MAPMIAPDTSAGALQGLEYLDSIRENRTGYTRNSAGIDNDALTNSTATGMQMQLSQSQLRLEMIARTIAETGARDTFRVIHALTLKHSTRAEKVRLRGKWVDINPREWVRRSDLSITIGLGTGTPEQQLAKLMGLAPLVQQGQMMGLVGVEEGYEYAKEAFKLSGYKSPDRFLKAPQPGPPGPDGQPTPPQMPPPPPSPQEKVAQINAQTEMQKLQAATQADAQKSQAELQADAHKFQAQSQLDRERQQAELAVQASNDQRQQQLDAYKHQQDMEQLAIKAQIDREEMLLNDKLERDRMAMEYEFKERDSQRQAAVRSQEIHTKEAFEDRRMIHQETEAKAKAEPKPQPKRSFKIKRGPDGRMSELEAS
jgi:hypothetical protein